jgi:GT2 family glycosyltransferase
MPENQRVSIIIVNWNGEPFLERCLNALMAQTLKPHEIILVDNASTDRSIEIARRFSAVHLILLDKNIGFASANNLAIALTCAASEWVGLLNPDAFVEPVWLERMLSAAKSNPDFDSFCCMLVNAKSPTLADGTGDAFHISGLVWRMTHGQPVAAAVHREREVFAPCAAAALYRRSIFHKAGNFDEDFFCYFEDVDLGFRLRLSGYRCLFVPGAVAQHVGSGSSGGQHSDFATYHGHRNIVWTFVKNMPGVLFWLLLPLHLALNVVTLFWFAGHGRAGVIFRAKRDAILGLPKMWRKRQVIQKQRVASIRDIWRQLDIMMRTRGLTSMD